MTSPRDQAHTTWIRPGTFTTGVTQFPLVWGGQDDPASDKTGDPAGGENKDDKPGATEGDDSGGKVLTQEQVNAIVAREVSKAQRGKLDPKELGFDSGKEMMDFIEKAKQQAEENKDEATKAIEEAKTQAVKDAEERVMSVANQRLIKAEFKIAAKDAGIEFLDDAYVLAQTLDDIWTPEVDDKGNVSGFDKAFFEELKEKKPLLWGTSTDDDKGSKGPGDIGAGSRGGKNDAARLEELQKTYPALRR